MREQSELKWLPIEPTPEAIEWARRMEAVRQGYLQAFALPPEMPGKLLAEMNTNRPYLPASFHYKGPFPLITGKGLTLTACPFLTQWLTLLVCPLNFVGSLFVSMQTNWLTCVFARSHLWFAHMLCFLYIFDSLTFIALLLH